MISDAPSIAAFFGHDLFTYPERRNNNRMEEEWKKAQVFERNWWMNVRGQHPHEVIKGDVVSNMLLIQKGAPTKTVIDIGCGPLSLLQRLPVKSGTALDPIHYGDLEDEYEKKGIRRIIKCGEDLNPSDGIYDEAWIYNCLQHVRDPVKIIENAITVANTVRIFEWTHVKPYTGHIHELTPELIQEPFKKEKWHFLMSTRGYVDYKNFKGHYFTGIFTKNPSRDL